MTIRVRMVISTAQHPALTLTCHSVAHKDDNGQPIPSAGFNRSEAISKQPTERQIKSLPLVPRFYTKHAPHDQKHKLRRPGAGCTRKRVRPLLEKKNNTALNSSDSPRVLATQKKKKSATPQNQSIALFGYPLRKLLCLNKFMVSVTPTTLNRLTSHIN